MAEYVKQLNKGSNNIVKILRSDNVTEFKNVNRGVLQKKKKEE